MPMKLLDVDDFRNGAKSGAVPEGTLFKFATTEAQAQGGEDSRVMRFVFSDATIDHAGDSIDPKGWDTAIFKRNPVALFAHNSWDPPIGRASSVSITKDQLVGDIEFASAEVYPFADTIYQLVKGKFLNAVSVGFKPKEWAFTSDKNRPYGIDFKKQTLLEISVCPVPCNPNALGEARSAGVDTAPLREWAEKVLDTGDVVFMPRKDLEALRTQSGAPERRFYVQADRPLSLDEVGSIRDAVKGWDDDPTSIPVLPKGVILRTAEDWKCGAATDLTVDQDGDWDGPAAEASIFEHAGGAEFDPAIAAKGFLAYDASAPKLRGSYKLPFALVADGEMKAMASGVRAAASRLPDTDIPDGVMASARLVLNHYEAKAPGKMLEGLVDKAGRKVSAATKAKLQTVLDHHAAGADSYAAATKCIQDLMGDDGPSDDPEDDIDPPADPAAEPITDDMTPEQRRVKDARALKASLQLDT